MSTQKLPVVYTTTADDSTSQIRTHKYVPADVLHDNNVGQ